MSPHRVSLPRLSTNRRRFVDRIAFRSRLSTNRRRFVDGITFFPHLSTNRRRFVDRIAFRSRLARERHVCGARCRSKARLAREKPVCGARCRSKARPARERPVCGAKCQCSAEVFSTSAPGLVCRPVPTASLSSAGNSEPSGRARYSGREINSSPPRPDELPSKKFSSAKRGGPSTEPPAAPPGENFFCAACSLPPAPQLHPRPKEQFFQSHPSIRPCPTILRSANSFSVLEMNGWASGFISWPLFARIPLFLGHEMNKRALPSNSWPSGRERSFLPSKRRGKLLLRSGCFPAEPRTAFFVCFLQAREWVMQKGGDGDISRPSAGALEGLLLLSENIPSAVAPPTHLKGCMKDSLGAGYLPAGLRGALWKALLALLRITLQPPLPSKNDYPDSFLTLGMNGRRGSCISSGYFVRNRRKKPLGIDRWAGTLIPSACR